MSATRCVPQGIAQAIRTLLLGSILLTHTFLAVSQAQLSLDGSLGPRGPLAGPDYRIGAELGQIRGKNLFHSFGQFNVGTGESATFTGPSTIANLVGRVTGGQPSSIDGQLRSEITGANLFLLNPGGVMFGPHASLEVSGAFHVSTADVLRFADGTTFSAHLSQETVLTVAPPAAFGFLGANPASITIRGSALQVPIGQTLSVVGGEVDIAGQGLRTADSVPTLGAPGGRIHIASVAAAGDVPVNLPELHVNAFGRLGRVVLSQGAFIDASGEGGGAVLIRNGHLMIDGSAIFADNLGEVDGMGFGVDLHITGDAIITQGALITTDGLGAGRARDLRIMAGSVLMTDAAQISSSPFNSGDGGNVVVQVGQLTLTGGAQISSTTFGLGKGGTLTVAATDILAITGRDSEGNPSGLFSNAFGRGGGGRVFVSAPTLRMDDGLIQAVSVCESCGDAGDIEVRGGRFTLTGGAQIDIGTRGLGLGGALTVAATETIAIAGRDSKGNPSGLFSNAFGRGAAGRLFTSAPTVSIEGGRIQSSSLGDGNAGPIALEIGRLTLTGGARVSSTTRGLGRGGDLTVAATETIAIAGRDSEGNLSGLFSATQGPGKGGDLRAAAARFRLSDGGTISASSSGAGDAGTVLIQAGETFQSQNGAVTTAAEEAGGGAIRLKAGSLIWLTDSVLTTTVRGGGGDAGNITADTRFGILAGSQIIANAFEGMGGNISIQAQQVFLADPASTVSASSTLGIDGRVSIQAPVTSISGTVALLPQSFARAAELLRDRCAERLREGAVSRFVLGGRDGVPVEPGEWFPSALGALGPQHRGHNEPRQEERRTESVGVWRLDEAGQAHLEGHNAQPRWPVVLDVECARWMGRQGTAGNPIP